MQSDERKRKRASDIYDQGRDAVVHKIVERETKVEMIGEHLKKLEARVHQVRKKNDLKNNRQDASHRTRIYPVE